MVKLIFHLVCLLFLPGLFAFAQKDTAAPLMTLKVEAVACAVDNLDNFYLLTSGDQLKKYNSRGDSVAVYNNVKKFGKLHSIDVSNPLKLVLFYKDFSTVVVLDRFLSLRTSLDLRRYNVLQAAAAGLSYDNNLWVFDAISNKLKKLNEQGNTLLETADFRMIFPTSVLPDKIWDRDGFVYLYDPAAGLFVFDYYGTFKKKYPIIGWSSLSVLNKLIVGMENNSIQAFNTATLLQKSYPIPAHLPAARQYMISKDKLLLLSKDAVHLYRFRF